MGLNLIIAIDWFLPGTNSGGPVRSITNMVAQLEDVHFFIITRNTDYCSNEAYTTIISNSWNRFSENVQVYYFSKDNLSQSHIKEVIRGIDAQVIYINGVYSRYFSIYTVQIARDLGFKTILATRGMLSPHAVAVKPLKKKLFLSVANMLGWYKDVIFHATQEDEKTDIQHVIKQYKKIEVIPNFPRKVGLAEVDILTKQVGAVRFIALGRISEEKGTLVSIQALQYIHGEVHLDLYGTIYDKEYWTQCQQLIDKLPGQIVVNYKGTLDAEKVLSVLQEYHFLLLPSKGENFGHAIVESFLVNRPVIISKHTPWKDLESKQLGYDVREEDLASTLQHIVEMNDAQYQLLCKSIERKKQDFLNIEHTRNAYLCLISN